jgi:CRP-like cAMP-binding protein
MNIHNIVNIMENDTEIFNILKNCPYEILKQWEIEDYPEETVVCRQGEIYDYFYIIVSGLADIYITAENGKKYSQAVYSKGNYIGELEIFEEKPYICSVQALTQIRLLVLRREYFLKWIEMDKNINSYMLQTLCSQFYRLSQKAGEDTLHSLKQRVCKYLINSGNGKTKCENQVIVNIEKEQLSEKFAVTQRSINRILQYLKEKDIIDVNSTYIIIKDIDELKKEEEKSRCE